MGGYYVINSYNVLPPLTRVTPQQLSVLATEDSTIVDITFTAPTDIDTGWDGTYEGEPAPVGFYTYDVQYSGMLNGPPFVEYVKSCFKPVR